MKYHLIGIGGIGMSGLAKMLKQKGHDVQGSDLLRSYVTDALNTLSIPVFFGHNSVHVPEGATVVFNTDIPSTNPELLIAKEKGYPLMHRSDLLAFLASGFDTLAVTGTHGKTTTSSLLAHVFLSAKKDPSFAVGGMVQSAKTNASLGSSPYFILEADESDGTFLKYPYRGACVTNIDTDHLAYFGSWENLVVAFEQFMNNSKDSSTLFYCMDDPPLAALRPRGVSYGFSPKADLMGSQFRQERGGIVFTIDFQKKKYSDMYVSLLGKHNALNALAVFGLALTFGLSEKEIRRGFATFEGVKRRLENKGTVYGVALFDDYAHHPTEIQATLKAMKEAKIGKKLIAVFQPHRFSRMRYVMDEIGSAFTYADQVIVTDLYTAGEVAVPEVSTESIYGRIKEQFLGPCEYIARKALKDELLKIASSGDVLITLGAGDITYLSDELLHAT